MLTPDYLQGAPYEVEGLYMKLEEEMIADICRRIAKTGMLTDTAEHQLIRMRELGAGTDYLKTEIEKYSGLSAAEVDRLFFDAGQTSSDFYEKVYKSANKSYTPFEYNEFLQQTMTATVNQTKGELRNMTASMGFSYRGSNGVRRFHTAAETYRDCLDYAYTQVSSGATDYITAIRNATKRLTDSGLQVVDWASGHTDHVDVAVRRAVLTGLSQMTGKIAEHNAAELDTDIVEVDAHAGARPDHAAWQGRWFSLSGKSKKYPSLVAVTGYGTVTGLKGANCRHDYYPVIPGISEPSYTEEELKNIDPPPFTDENGKTYTYYEATQRQRQIERAIRKTKRELLGAQNNGDEDTFLAKSVLLRRQREEYDRFSKKAGLLTQNERHQVYGYNRSISAKSVAGYNKLLTLGDGDATIGLRIYRFKQDIANGKINTAVDTSNQGKHLYSKEWKNQVKQAVQAIKTDPDTKLIPKSVLANGVDPQKIIDKYAGKGDGYKFKGKNKYPDEFITLPFVVGKTFDKKSGKYVETHRAQLKYDEHKGIHVFPVEERGK